MCLQNKLDETKELLNKLDGIIYKKQGYDELKNQISNITDNLSSYKELSEKKIDFQSDEAKQKIEKILTLISQLEKLVNNKLLISKKYSIFLNS